MKILSYNIRGLGGRLKKKEVKELITKFKPDVVCLQETKVCDHNSLFVPSLWGNLDVDWKARDCTGRSGGIWISWRTDKFRLLNHWTEEGVVGVEGEWIGTGKICVIANIYSSCDFRGKLELWNFLLRKMNSSSFDHWCLIGDFNEIRHPDERKGKEDSYFSASMRKFDEFVREAGLFDLQLGGRKYTWSRLKDSCCSRIDRALVSDAWLRDWTGCKLMGLSKGLSDHCPILLHNQVQDWGPKPFKFFDVWLKAPGFKKFVEDKWKGYEIQGWGGYILKEKLKLLRNDIKKWSKDSFGELNGKIEQEKALIDQFDRIQEDRDLVEDEIVKIRDAKSNLWHLLKVKAGYAFQKARVQWIKEGDANTAFFHRSINRRNKANEIEGLRINNEWVDDVQRVKECIHEHFKNQFSRNSYARPTLKDVDFKRLDGLDNEILIAPFVEEEVRRAVWDCGSNKSPGPDGFTFNFIREMWPTLKSDIMRFFEEFHHSGIIVRGGNASFVTLISKKGNPQRINDFRPISLVGCIYKILAKVLAKRLAKVVGKVISDNQSAFAGGKQALDGILILNEVVDFMKREKKECMLLKVDFEKAYDTVLWDYLDEMLACMNFCSKWRKWIQCCLCSATASVLVNGSPSGEFVLQKGLRQGDPLSPFLFLIAAEGVSAMMYKAESLRLFKVIEVGREAVGVSHLQFADDTIIVGSASDENAKTIKGILRLFELASGLKVNFSKSSLIGINTGDMKAARLASIVGCNTGMLPFSYLGLPVGANHRKREFWQPLIDRYRRKLSGWDKKFFSFGGRIVILNSILSALPVYYLSFAKIPVHREQEGVGLFIVEII